MGRKIVLKEAKMSVKKIKWYEQITWEDAKDSILFAIGPSLVAIGIWLSLK